MSEPLAVVETTNPNLVLPEKAQQARFELGTCLALYQWEDLTTAVDNQWGGPDSADKREWMVGSIVELFEMANYVDSDDIEDRILGIMQDEFGVSIEDNTAAMVAVNIIKIYKECAENNFGTVDALMAKYQEKEQRKARGLESTTKIVLQNENGEESESDDEDEEMDVESSQSYSNQTPISHEPVVDEDGFELVQRKGRKK